MPGPVYHLFKNGLRPCKRKGSFRERNKRRWRFHRDQATGEESMPPMRSVSQREHRGTCKAGVEKILQSEPEILLQLLLEPVAEQMTAREVLVTSVPRATASGIFGVAEDELPPVLDVIRHMLQTNLNLERDLPT
jgi:hypothetical protein